MWAAGCSGPTVETKPNCSRSPLRAAAWLSLLGSSRSRAAVRALFLSRRLSFWRRRLTQRRRRPSQVPRSSSGPSPATSSQQVCPPHLFPSCAKPSTQTLTPNVSYLYSDLINFNYIHVLCLLTLIFLQKLSGVYVYTHVLYCLRALILMLCDDCVIVSR